MSSIVEKVLAGDVLSVARLIRNIDDRIPEAIESLKLLYPHTGKSYVIGITGSPGVGKSTLVDNMITQIRKQNKTVGVLAVDPTSPFTGGAILGDRARMQKHSADSGVFIRSLATRGQFGGLTQSTRGAIDVLDAMGKDFIIVETVGVGQDEVEIAKSAHTTIIVVIPGMGDEIQAIKAGIFEVGDIFLINKTDMKGVNKAYNYLRLMINMEQKKYSEGIWKPLVLKVNAVSDEEVAGFIKEIETHKKYLLEKSSYHEFRREENRVSSELIDIIKNRLVEEFLAKTIESNEFKKAVALITKGETDPYTAADNIMLPLIQTLYKSSS